MRAAFRIIALVLVSLLAACARVGGTIEQRTASFAAHEKTRIDGKSTRDYLLLRSALLIGGKGIEARFAKKPSGTSFDLRLRVKSRCVIFGTATAIDRLGFFLTAAHNLDEPVCYMAYYDRGMKLLPARVVWRGNEKNGEPDVAVVRVDEPLGVVFPWAATCQPGGIAFSAGLNSGEKARFEMVGTAGPILNVASQRNARVSWTIIAHETPLRRGDSGGPLVTPSGGLLGINTEIRPFSLLPVPRFTSISIAHRPHPDFIRSVIEKDFATRGGNRSGVVRR